MWVIRCTNNKAATSISLISSLLVVDGPIRANKNLLVPICFLPFHHYIFHLGQDGRKCALAKRLYPTDYKLLSHQYILAVQPHYNATFGATVVQTKKETCSPFQRCA